MNLQDLLYLWILVILPQYYTASIHKRRHKQTQQPADYIPNSLPLKPSLVMVPLDLQETPNKDLDPDLETLDVKELLDKMSSDYDNQYMSYTLPREMLANPNGTLEYEFKNGQRPRGPMPADFQMLEHRSMKLSEDGPEIKLRASLKTRRKLQKFLWAYSYCPVRYKWKELSSRFWPRYIRTGACESKRSCSIPSGMTCQPSKISHIKLLRYYCPYSYKKSCTWIKIEYPILTECSCGCQQYSSDSDYRT